MKKLFITAVIALIFNVAMAQNNTYWVFFTDKNDTSFDPYEYFDAKGIDGNGMRICVLDGGFPGVDTHPAFKHIRDDHRIIATYNFPNKKEDVYGWSSHGTMVLSCIAGINAEDQPQRHHA